jgi:hypothetical protein
MNTETEELLRDLKREVVETRGLVIKTNHLATGLSGDIRLLGRRVEDHEREQLRKGAAGIAIGAIVALVAVKLAWDAKVDATRAELERRGIELDRSKQELKATLDRESERMRAEQIAADLWELLRDGKRAEAIARADEALKEPLTKAERAFLQSAVEKARDELAHTLAMRGQDQLRAAHYEEAAAALEASLAARKRPPASQRLEVQLADAYRHLRRFKDALALVEPLVDGALEEETQDMALHQKAWVEMDSHEWEAAKSSWRMHQRRFPDSTRRGEAFVHLKQLIEIHPDKDTGQTR